MLQLSNVSKFYVSQTGQDVRALNDVSVCLPDRGLVCILGKSGSGKSTLLNLLGGLDKPTSGDISVDGLSLASFSPADCDAYRNDYLGFIFQEFNLLSDLNVRQNIALALQLNRGENDTDIVAEALRQVGLDDSYFARRIGELSGGEKQRVAIARCIVKNSKLLLADEPTGNLDSSTAESIWTILKNLSQSRTVVVVTHDRESAQIYADRLIELDDGKLVSDTNSQHPLSDVKQPKFISKKLPFKTAVTLGWGNIKSRAVKTVNAVLLLVFCVSALLITQMFFCFSVPRTIGQFTADYNVPFVLTTQQAVGRNEKGKTQEPGIIKPRTEAWLDSHADYIVNCTVSSSEQLRRFGFSFVGKVLEPLGNSYYVTSDFLDSAILDGAYMIADGVLTRILPEVHSYDLLVGKQVYLSQIFSDDTEFPTLCGVINSDSVPASVEHYMPPVFASEDFGDYYWAHIPKFSSVYNGNGVRDVTAYFGDIGYSDSFFITPVANDNVAMTAQNVTEYVCGDNEIILSYEMLSALYDVEPKQEFFQTRYGEDCIVACPKHVGQRIHFAITDSDTGKTLVDLGELTIAGVSFKTITESKNNMQITLSPSRFDRVVKALKCGAHILVAADRGDPSSLFVQLDRRSIVLQMGGAVQTDDGGNKDCVEVTLNVQERLMILSVVMIVIALILLVIMGLMISNLIGCGILDRSKDIGILSALGIPYRNIYVVFLMEVVFIAVIGFIFSLCLSFGFAALCNNIYSSDYMQSLQFFRVDFVTLPTAVISAFVFPLLAALVPLRKISKLNPIDAIRHL